MKHHTIIYFSFTYVFIYLYVFYIFCEISCLYYILFYFIYFLSIYWFIPFILFIKYHVIMYLFVLIYIYLFILWIPHMAEQKQGDQLEPTYGSSVRLPDVALRTCLKRWKIGRSGERGSGISVLVAQDDDDMMMWNITCLLIYLLIYL